MPSRCITKACTGGTVERDKLILVVDDDEYFLKVIAEMVRELGFSVTTESDAEGALAAIEKRLPRAAIIDGLLPGMRGEDLARLIRERHSPEELPIVFMSAFFRDAQSDERVISECKASAVLHKPLSREELAKVLAKLLDEQLADAEYDTRGIEDILPEFLIDARRRSGAMRRAIESLGQPEEEQARELLKIESHRLRGTGGCFALPELTRISAGIENLLLNASADRLGPEDRARLYGLVHALDVKITEASARHCTPPACPDRLHVGLLDGDTRLAASCRKASACSQPIRVVPTVDEALARLHEARESAEPGTWNPFLFFVAADQPGIDAVAAARLLRAAGMPSIVLIGPPGPIERRLEMLHDGIQGLVPRLHDADALLGIAESFAPRLGGAVAVVAGGDGERLRALRAALAGEGLAVEHCPDPEDIFAVLGSVDGSLVLLDASLPKYSPLDLLRVLRADPLWRHVPILLFGSSSIERKEALAAGADDLLDEDASMADVASRVRAQVQRLARMRGAPLIDPLSGTLVAPYFYQAAGMILSLAERGRKVALLLLELDPAGLADPRGRARQGALVTDMGALLRRAFRSSDIVARVGPTRFAVLLHDVTREKADILLSKLLRSYTEQRELEGYVDEHRVPLLGAVASFPETLGGLSALMAEAAARMAPGTATGTDPRMPREGSS